MPLHRVRGSRRTILACALGLGLPGGPLGCQGPGGSPLPDGTNDEPVSFSRQVEPILTSVCATCHQQGGAADLEGIPLRLTADAAYDMLVGRASVQQSDLLLVAPGDAEQSYVFQKISRDNPPVGLRMPQFAPPLPETQIALIRDWIDQGAMDN